MTTPEPGQRGMIRTLVHRQYPIRHVLDQAPLDPPGGPLACAVGIQQHPQHHHRVIHRTTTTISTIGGIEPRHIQLRDHIKNEERQMIFRQPIFHRRWHQEQLIQIARAHVHGHEKFSRENTAGTG
jgi:hypothetical protein